MKVFLRFSDSLLLYFQIDEELKKRKTMMWINRNKKSRYHRTHSSRITTYIFSIPYLHLQLQAIQDHIELWTWKWSENSLVCRGRSTPAPCMRNGWLYSHRTFGHVRRRETLLPLGFFTLHYRCHLCGVFETIWIRYWKKWWHTKK